MKRLIPLLLSFVLIAGSVFQTPVFAASIDQPAEVPAVQEIETAEVLEEPEEVPVEEPDGSAEEVAEGSGEEFVEESVEEDGFVEEPEFSEPEISPDDFADATFWNYVLDQFDVNSDGCLSTAEADAVTSIDVSAMGVTDIGGIFHFTNLETLNCADNALESLDVSANTNLLYLDCRNNRITSLNLINNSLLETLECDGNPLTELVLAEDSALKEIPELNGEQESLEAEEEAADPDVAEVAEEAETEETELLGSDPEGPLALYLDGTFVGDYQSFEEAFKHLSANGANEIRLWTDIEAQKFVLPTRIANLTIKSKDGAKKTLSLSKIRSLSPAFDLTIENVSIISSGVTTFAISAKRDLTLKNVNFSPRANLSVAADHTLSLSGDFTGNIGKVSGTKTSELQVQDKISVDEVATFQSVQVAPSSLLRVSGKVSGIGLLNGDLHLVSDGETDTAVINKIETANLILEYDKTKKSLLSKVTVTDVTVFLNVKVVDSDDEFQPSALPSGIPILTAGSEKEFEVYIDPSNKDTDGNDLTAFRYNKEIRAEWESALTLEADGESFDCPNLEVAFKKLSPTGYNEIVLHKDFAPAKFVLPTGIEELSIKSDSYRRSLTLPKIKTLAPSFILHLKNVDIKSSDVTTLSVNAKKDIYIEDVTFLTPTNISVAAGAAITIYGQSNGIEKLSGTKTSTLAIWEDQSVSEIATFKSVWISDYPAAELRVSKKVSGIESLQGKLRMLSADKASSAVINKAEGTISLAYDNGAVTKATITGIPGLLKIAVYDVGTDTLSKLPSGTPILTAGSTDTEDFINRISLDNRDPANHQLNVYAYNKEIRAEFSGALTLNGTDYPNFEKAFENLVENSENTITLHTDLALAKFALPTKKIKKLSIIGDGTHEYDKRNITLPKVTSLAPSYELLLKKVSFYSNGASSFAIKAKDDLDFENVDFFPTANISVPAGHSITLAGNYCTGIGKVSGTNRSSLIVQDDVFVNEAANFQKVSITNGKTFRVFGKVSGIDTLVKGTLQLSTSGTPTASVIKTVNTATLILDYIPAQQALLSKVTVTDVTGTLTVRAVDHADGTTLCALPSGLPILTAGSAKDFTDKITIVNKDVVDTHALKAYRYGKEIRAEYAGALTLSIGGVNVDYPNFEKAFEHLSPNQINRIELHTDLAPTTFKLPTKIDYLHIESDTSGTKRKLTLPKIKSLTPTFSMTLTDIDLESSGVSEFAINAKMGIKISNTTFSPFVSISGGPGVNVDIGNLNNGVYGIENLSGTKTTKLFVCDDLVVYGDIKTFSELSVWTGRTLKVMGKVSGIEELNKGSNNKGTLYLSSAGETDTAVIKNVVNDTTLILDYDPARQALLSKVTVTDVKGTLTIKALDVNDSSKVSALPLGLPILTAGSTNDFTDKITIVNKDADDHTLTARRHGKVIKAEY